MAENATTTAFENVKEAAGGRFERARLFLSEVRNELKRVTWPSQKEVYATTVVVILTSVFFGLYLFALDFGLLTARAVDLPRRFGRRHDRRRDEELVHRPHLLGLREEGRRVAAASASRPTGCRARSARS